MLSLRSLYAFLAGVDHIDIILHDITPHPCGAIYIGCQNNNCNESNDCYHTTIHNKLQCHNCCTSNAKLIIKKGLSLVTKYDATPKTPEDIAQILHGLSFVVADCSSDSVITFILFIAIHLGIDIAPFPHAWVDHVDRWKCTGNATNPWTAWCCLQSSLAHSYFSKDRDTKEQSYRKAWLDSVRFAAKCLQRQYDPDHIPESLPGFSEWQRAYSALLQEKQAYENWLHHAIKTQLSLPLSGGRTRRLLVDALVIHEEESTGSAKVFYRNDASNTLLGNGFSFAAHHRPTPEDNDINITITVDPRKDIHLAELWGHLEDLENKAWGLSGEERPKNSPRKLTGYDNVHDEPWFINPEGTLVASPNRLQDGRPGSKLSWQDVKEAIWHTYNPVEGARLYSILTNETIPYTKIKPTVFECHRKNIVFARWINEDRVIRYPAARLLSSFHVLQRISATIVNNAQQKSPSIDNLSGNSEWSTVNLKGGFAIITASGIFVLDDWNEHTLNTSDLFDCLYTCSSLDIKLDKINRTIVYPLVEKSKTIINGSSNLFKVDNLIKESARVSLKLAELRAAISSPPDDSDAISLFSELTKRWTLDSRLIAMETKIKAIDSSLRAIGDLRTTRLTKYIAIFGFPFFLSNAITPHISKYINGTFKTSTMDGEYISSLGITLLIAIPLCSLLYFLLSKNETHTGNDTATGVNNAK